MATRASRVWSPNLRIPAFSIQRRWPEFLTFVALMACVGAALLGSHYGIADQIPWTKYYLIWLVPVSVLGLVTLFVWLTKLIRAGEEHPIRATLAKLRSFSGRSYIEFFIPILVMAPFIASFTTFKTIIGKITTYSADPMLSRIDGSLGFQPWQLSHALIGPVGTIVVDLVYLSWFLLVQMMLFAILFVPRLRNQRPQVLLTFVLSWIILGTILAIALPSVGPCYYGKFYQPDLYADLMHRLQAMNEEHTLSALRVQNSLWMTHSAEAIALGSGLSAMPSMHVSIATIIALLLRRLRLAWIGWPFLAVIWIGSFHLGWHYAIDGIVSVLGTLAIWKLVARWLQGDAPLAVSGAAVPVRAG